MLTIRPRAVSRVCRMALNCASRFTRSSAFSASQLRCLLGGAIEFRLAGGPLQIVLAFQAIRLVGGSRFAGLILRLELIRVTCSGRHASVIFPPHAIRVICHHHHAGVILPLHFIGVRQGSGCLRILLPC